MLFFLFFTLSLLAILFSYSYTIWCIAVLFLFVLLACCKTKLSWAYYGALFFACMLPLISVKYWLSFAHKDYEYLYVWEITIIEQYWPEKFLVRDRDQQIYFLWSTQTLFPGETYRTAAYKKTYVAPSLSWDIPLWKKDLWEYSFNYDNRLFMKWIAGTLYTKSLVRKDSWSPNLIQKAKQLYKQNVTILLDNKEHQSLLLGMTIGDKSTMSDKAYQEFIASGLVHLIAVSGGNIIVVIAMMSACLCWVPFYIRLVITWCWVVLFTLLCGADSSIMRAAIMASLWLFALMAGRSVSIWRMMGIAWVVMLVINPFFLLYDLWFILSFAALSWIIIVDEMYTKSGCRTSVSNKRKHVVIDKVDRLWTSLCRRYIVPTIGATCGVFPLLLFFTGTYNLTSILGNILIVPLVPLIMIWWGLLACLQWLVAMLFPWLLSQLVKWCVLWLALVIETSKQIISYGYIVSVHSSIYALSLLLWWWAWLMYNIYRINKKEEH